MTDNSSKWIQWGPGVAYQQLSIDGEWPEVVVLKLSTAQYKEFLLNPAKFTNDHQFFSASVRDPSDGGVTLTAPQESGGSWLILIGHGRMSRNYFGSVPQPPND